MLCAGGLLHQPRPDWLLEKYRLQGKRVVLFVGAIDRAHYFKGIPILLQALAHSAIADLSLIIVGRGDLQSVYEQQAATIGLSKRVHFAGYVPDSDLPHHYRLADVTVLPSTTAGEAFGLILLESLACGTPVIASNLVGVRTVVDSGMDGWLVPPADVEALAGRLAALLSIQPERLRVMGQSGRVKVVSRYAWSRIGDLLDDLYREIIVARRKPTVQGNAGVGGRQI
jgi:glycosyltransferase involved in cell wall biosynthesis